MQAISELIKQSRKVLVICHDDPDIDALASSAAVAAFCRHHNVPCVSAFAGKLTHTQNRVFACAMPFASVELTDEYRGFDGTVIAVDTSCLLGTGNMALAGKTGVPSPSAVIDHTKQPAALYHNERLGSCSTIMYEWLSGNGITIDRALATAMLLGIESDTDFLRGESTTDRDRPQQTPCASR